MVTYEEAEALIQRSGLRPTDLISEADIRRAVIDMRWFGNLDPKFYNIFYMIRKEQVSIVNERVEREYLKNPFYLTPEELEKKALLWFKANHETVKQKVHPGWARQIHELENAYREAAAQQQATNQEGEDGFHRATDAWRAEQEEGQEVRDRRKDFEDSKHAQAGLEKRRYASLYDNASAEDEVYKARVRLDAARDAEEAERDERRREMPHGGGYEEWSKQNVGHLLLIRQSIPQ